MVRRSNAPRVAGRRVTKQREKLTAEQLADRWSTPIDADPLAALEAMLAAATGRVRFYSAIIEGRIAELGEAALAVANRFMELERNDLLDLEHRERETVGKIARDLASVHSVLERIVRVELGLLVGAIGDLRADERLGLTPEQHEAFGTLLVELLGRWEPPRREIGPVLELGAEASR